MKTFEIPTIEIDRFDVEDICTASNPEGTSIWEGYDGYTDPYDGGVEGDGDFDW